MRERYPEAEPVIASLGQELSLTSLQKQLGTNHPQVLHLSRAPYPETSLSGQLSIVSFPLPFSSIPIKRLPFVKLCLILQWG